MTDEGCICRGNWRELMAKYTALFGTEWLWDVDGHRYELVGLLDDGEDYCYAMVRPGWGILARFSCVSDLEGHGFVRCDEAAEGAKHD